jgi:hypothetical protein
MLEAVADTISGPDSDTINWSHSRDEIVAGVEALFAMLHPQQAQEQKDEDEKWRDAMDMLFDLVKSMAEVAGEEVVYPVTAGVVMLFAELYAISDGYRQAAEDIKRDRAARGFMEGLAMGVLRETPANVRDYFWEESPEGIAFFEQAGKLAQAYYNGGLVLGYAQGTNVALKGLGQAFWTDLRRQVSEPLGDPDAENWGRNEWISFYIAAGTAFYRGHITE